MIGFIALAALYAPMAEAAESGAIRGHVVDDGGLDVPGAVITLSGPGIAGELSVTADENGDFRFLSVPVGTHDFRAAMGGLTPIRRVVTVRLDETATVPVTLKVAGMEEVLVEETLPVIDTTRSAVSTELSNETLAHLPVGRSFQDAVNMLPGISGRVDTETGGPGSGNPSVRGEGQSGNNYLVDGISTRDPATKTFGANVNFDAIEDIQVYTDGAPAEFGQATGMMVNVVTKDGGDEHHGSAIYTLTTDFSPGKYDIADLDKHEEVATKKRDIMVNTLSLTAGGPVIKETLWYFVAVDAGRDTTAYEGTSAAAPYLGQSIGGFAKLTWFAAPGVVLRYQFNGELSGSENDETSPQVLPEAQSRSNSDDQSHLLRLSWAPGETTLVDTEFLVSNGHSNSVPMSGETDTPPILNLETSEYGSNYNSEDLNERQRLGGTLKVTHLVDNVLGSHKLKVGMEAWRLYESRKLIYSGWTSYTSDASQGLPCTAPLYADCVDKVEYSAAGKLGHEGLLYAQFIQDDWSPVDPLTLNLGVRLDHETLYESGGSVVLDQWMPAPRLGAAWDATGDSKTLVSVNAGRYFDVAGNTFASWGDSKSANGFTYYTFDADTGGYVKEYTQSPEPLIFCNDYSLGALDEATRKGAGKACNGSLRPYHMDKLVLGVEREVIPLLAVGVRGILSQTVDLPEDINYDDVNWVITNPPNKRRDYWGVELTVERKFDDAWQVLASYTYSESTGTHPGQDEVATGSDFGSAGNDVGVWGDDVNDQKTRREYFEGGQGAYLDGQAGLGTQSDDAGYSGYLPYHSFHSAKINGSYTAPWGTTVGVVYEFDSGHAWQKRGYLDNYQDYSAFPEGRGTRFMPAAHYIDMRLAQELSFGDRYSAELAINVYNVADFSTAITYDENDDQNFGLTLYRQAPRSVEAQVKFTY